MATAVRPRTSRSELPFGTARGHDAQVPRLRKPAGEHFGDDRQGLDARRHVDHGGRLLDGIRGNVRLALLASVLTIIGFIGLLASFDPGQGDQRLGAGLALVGGVACWAILCLLGTNEPWSGDTPAE